MLTYIINTSTNKTFDSDELFKLVGYQKIEWIECSLNNIESASKQILIKQSVLDAEQFQVAVLVDFYDFDLIRKPYGFSGSFNNENNTVDNCIYFPFIESYLIDHLFNYLSKKNTCPSRKDIFYVEGVQNERFNLSIKNKDSIEKIIEPDIASDSKEDKFSCFNLHCTPEYNLKFNVTDYPYKSLEPMTKDDFIDAFIQRANEQYEQLNNRIFIHHYYCGNSVTQVSAAFDVLSLSLYLIKNYERGEIIGDFDQCEVARLEPSKLKDTLENSWNKIRAAKILAQNNEYEYYDIAAAARKNKLVILDKDQIDEKDKGNSYLNASKKFDKIPTDINVQYQDIISMTSGKVGELPIDQQDEIDGIVATYLDNRDETRDTIDENELDVKLKEEGYEKRKQCPSNEEFNQVIKEKEKNLSDYLENIFSVTFLSAKYQEIKENAVEAMKKYKEAKAMLNKKITIELILLALILICTMVPYIILHSSGREFKAEFFIHYLIAASIFVGIFLLSTMIVMVPIIQKLNSAKTNMKTCYKDCLVEREYSISKIRNMYDTKLIVVEKARNEIRTLRLLQKINNRNNERVNMHRSLLDDIENKLSSLLNNLGVQPTENKKINVFQEFNITKPFNSSDNKIYKIFSLEVIESLFEKKKDEVK